MQDYNELRKCASAFYERLTGKKYHENSDVITFFLNSIFDHNFIRLGDQTDKYDKYKSENIEYDENLKKYARENVERVYDSLASAYTIVVGDKKLPLSKADILIALMNDLCNGTDSANYMLSEFRDIVWKKEKEKEAKHEWPV